MVRCLYVNQSLTEVPAWPRCLCLIKVSYFIFWPAPTPDKVGLPETLGGRPQAEAKETSSSSTETEDLLYVSTKPVGRHKHSTRDLAPCYKYLTRQAHPDPALPFVRSS